MRHLPAGGRPLYRPPQPGDGRWQRGEVVEGFYLADRAETAWAEWYRALAELAVSPMRQMPRDLWRYRVDLPRVADLSNPERLERVGLPAPVPARNQWPGFQAVGEALWAEGWAGLMCPSAARPVEGSALCVFRHQGDIEGITPDPPPERYNEPPAPPRGLRT